MSSIPPIDSPSRTRSEILGAGGAAAIRVLIADDHEVVTEGLRCLLAREPGIEVLDCVANGREAVERTQSAAPDLVLMDYLMPGLNGIEATILIKRRMPSTAVVMLSSVSDPYVVVRALRAGAAGYVPKSGNVRDVVRAIRETIAGRRYLHHDVSDRVLTILMSGEAADDASSVLSSRERQVLQLIAEGRTNAQIAIELSLSPRSVETYRGRMRDKLDLRDLAELVRFAIRHGISPLE